MDDRAPEAEDLADTEDLTGDIPTRTEKLRFDSPRGALVSARGAEEESMGGGWKGSFPNRFH